MKIGDIIYIVAIVIFAWITFGIIRGNFQRKFDKNGNRKDLNIDTDTDINSNSYQENKHHDSFDNSSSDSGD